MKLTDSATHILEKQMTFFLSTIKKLHFEQKTSKGAF